MELELKKNVMQCYQQILDTTVTQEETQEAIVPDAFPDMARIISVSGQICLSEKMVSEGEVSVTGHIDAMVLYESEEGGDVQKIPLRLPYRAQVSAEVLRAGDEIFVIASLGQGEARMLNPRKILVKMELMLEISGFQGNGLVLCCGVEPSSHQNVEVLMSRTEIQPLCTVQSKKFTFDETVTLQGQGELEQILSLRITPHCTESKLIGNKLIFKGETDVQLMYLDGTGELSQSRHALPFSQIMEVEDVGEGGHSTVSVVLESFYANPSYEGAKTVDITLDCLAQATVRGKKHLELLQDAYSTTHQISVDKTEYTLVTVAEEFLVPQPIRQIFETTMPVQQVEDSWVSVGKVTQTRDDNQLTFSCDLTISILCADESGARNTLHFSQPISHKIDCSPDVVSCCRCTCTGDVFATPAPGGIEVRLTPQFAYSMVEGSTITVVHSALLGESREKGTSTVVLRLPQPKETLWDIAKSYGTTISQIVEANKLEEPSPPVGKMILIPSCR